MSRTEEKKTFAAKSKEEVSEFINAQELKESQQVLDLIWMFSTPQGRRFAWWFLEMAIINVNAFTKDAETYHLLGRQATASKLRKYAETYCPDDWAKMIKENSKSYKQNKQAKEEN